MSVWEKPGGLHGIISSVSFEGSPSPAQVKNVTISYSLLSSHHTVSVVSQAKDEISTFRQNFHHIPHHRETAGDLTTHHPPSFQTIYTPVHAHQHSNTPRTSYYFNIHTPLIAPVIPQQRWTSPKKAHSTKRFNNYFTVYSTSALGSARERHDTPILLFIHHSDTNKPIGINTETPHSLYCDNRTTQSTQNTHILEHHRHR